MFIAVLKTVVVPVHSKAEKIQLASMPTHNIKLQKLQLLSAAAQTAWIGTKLNVVLHTHEVEAIY
jgi:hypothetical protein